MASMLRNQLPAIYEQILPGEFLNLSPEETKATCHNCAKSRPGPGIKPPYYDKLLKCCTYYPFLPNFLVGAILSREQGVSDLGFEKIRELIRERRFALPIGLCPPPGYQEKFSRERADSFGRDSDLLCPFYNFKNGECGVWRHRGHECATFFCVSSYSKGEVFWGEIRDFLHYIEMLLTQEAMIFKGYTSNEIDENLKLIEPLPQKEFNDWAHEKWQVSALTWSRLWAHHHDDIEGYYKATYDFVKNHAKTLAKQVSDEKFRTGAIDTRVLSRYLMGAKVSKNHSHGSRHDGTA